ncbi:GTPase HflX [Tuwongella immobilis]|uniref:GTPase HflX n=1 Tax=Tuwongella immobilis TaxID=692036 RepID=A0A6C2YRT9_9BACT|nr:GTPase HflX [Tuwongella immobilis]VIP04378.1 gtp-binding protein : GTPase HflX OS=Singulisphaera acidiphila (strain ATCC BAA-1392 / DSM 18658 / VKM B-2454 / MOB10) GN=hflX PE=3 SV=1: GTP-bdg_N: MMR_HSR1 [Tuwongella immobilis]VTS06118.1 gtp-binding protein : GTPase HflX OS=Singulisphaera acidiphila (strain ATCC BAA-1392 / DSM 18658 / VKM B-2454 / MOB10) GN=hflX PE=3 SV=1: GTP-bdg_N: MMR_HSR1 [Tuwongella immobilis]
MVSVSLPDRPWISLDPLDELRGLATTAGAKIVGELTQKRTDVHTNSYIGSGKLRELVEMVQTTDADVIIFDNDLSPGQVRNLEQATERKVIDRSELILDIFATRARSLESRLQVELAQLEYSLPRLKQMWSHLSRQKGGGIGLRGPGETQLEEDRRLVSMRIRDLKAKLVEVQGRKEREVASRSQEYTVSLVGYTNAGKSRLMNRLTGADVYVENKLFSTLDTRTRQWQVKDFGKVLLSDTVGFIRNLPHHLVASFKATLEEARQARLLLHVVDASNLAAEEHIRAVNLVLDELECLDKPTLLVLNKVDQVQDRMHLDVLRRHHPRAVAVSALTGEGIDDLRNAVIEMLSNAFVEADIVVDASNGKLLAYLAAHAEIFHQHYEGNLVVMRAFLPKPLVGPVQREAQSLVVRSAEISGQELHAEPNSAAAS